VRARRWLCSRARVLRSLTGLARGAQGHLRLILLPIVYNAMALKREMRALPLFLALEAALRASSYYPLLNHPPPAPADQGAAPRCCPAPRPHPAPRCLPRPGRCVSARHARTSISVVCPESGDLG
jgi:hypothetical protein